MLHKLPWEFYSDAHHAKSALGSYSIEADKTNIGKFILGITRGHSPFMPNYDYMEHIVQYETVELAKVVAEYHRCWFEDRTDRVNKAKAQGIKNITEVDLTNLSWSPVEHTHSFEAYDDLNYYEVAKVGDIWKLRVQDCRRAGMKDTLPIEFEDANHAMCVGDWYSVWSNATLEERNAETSSI